MYSERGGREGGSDGHKLADIFSEKVWLFYFDSIL